jgi:hypothetical protein
MCSGELGSQEIFSSPAPHPFSNSLPALSKAYRSLAHSLRVGKGFQFQRSAPSNVLRHMKTHPITFVLQSDASNTHAHASTHTHARTRTHASSHEHARTCTHACTHAHAHTHTNARTLARTYASPFVAQCEYFQYVQAAVRGSVYFLHV